MSWLLMSLIVLVGIGFDISDGGSLMDVEHIVIFMQENRAFDHYYGKMRGVRGFNDRAAPLLPTGRSPFYQPISTNTTSDYYNKYLLPYPLMFATTSATCMPAPEMDYGCDTRMWNNGKMDAWNTARAAGFGMSYFNRSDLPFYYSLGDNFLIGDYYFQSTLTATNPNRLHLFSGSNGLSVNSSYCIMDDSEPSSGINWVTMAETLQENNISWKVYQMHDNFDDNAFAWFDQFKSSQPGSVLYDNGLKNVPNLVEAFANDVANDTLPQVSWIVGPANLSEHAEYHPQSGEDLSARLIKVLGEKGNQEIYSKTVFILNYDEGGQFYDHLWLPTAPMNINDGKSTVSTYGEVLRVANDGVQPGNPIGPGFRVPMFIISPWTHKAGGIVYSELSDHTSVLQFVEKRFGVKCPNISPWRRVVMSDLLYAFDWDNPNYTFPILPDTSNNVNESDYECNKLPSPVAPEWGNKQYMPSQEIGTKISRALPYSFDILDNIVTVSNDNKLNITMINNGNAGAVLHIYNYLNMTQNPKKYTIELGKSLYDLFTIDNNSGKYNYSLHGPNGYVRQFAGTSNISSKINVIMKENGQTQSVTFVFGLLLKETTTTTGDKYTFIIEDMAYGNTEETVIIDNSINEKFISKSVKSSGNWYDYIVRLTNGPDSGVIYERRFMGRVETGQDSITDPAMAVERKDSLEINHPSPKEYFDAILPKASSKAVCQNSEWRQKGYSKDLCWSN